MCFNTSMRIQRIHTSTNFKNAQLSQNQEKKPELIDKLMNKISNPDDLNDCVAVPRGIFKAYLWIMSGFGMLGIAGALPKSKIKSALVIAGNICNIISAFFFAKGFAYRGMSPTVKMEDVNRH